MYFRWIEDLRVHEDFVGYYELPDIKSVKTFRILMRIHFESLKTD